MRKTTKTKSSKNSTKRAKVKVVSIESSENSKTKSLECELGKHKWSIPRRRGRYPRNCPKHVPVEVTVNKDARQEGIARKNLENRQAKIREILDGNPCRCDITVDTADNELGKMISCTDPFFICPTLVRVRNAVYTWPSYAIEEVE